MGSNNGEMGLRDEICVSINSDGTRINTRYLIGYSVEGLAQMAAVGLGLPPETFTDAGKYGCEYFFLAFSSSSQ